MDDDEDIYRDESATWERLKPGLLATAPGKFALIHGTEMGGVFDDETSALIAGYERWGYGKMFVHRIQEEDEVAFLPIVIWDRPCRS